MKNPITININPFSPSVVGVGIAWFLGFALVAVMSLWSTPSIGDAIYLIVAAGLATLAASLYVRNGRDYERMESEDGIREVLARRAGGTSHNGSDLRKAA